MPLIDLDTVDQELSTPGLLGTRWPALGWFRRRDYFGDPTQSLCDCVREEVARETGWHPDGSILLLTHLRYWGFVMNPLSIFYCLDRDGDLRATLLQVTNTPWREKTCYVFGVDPAERKPHRKFDKRMHVSPFNPMEMTYHCRLRAPGEKLFFHLENHRDGRAETDATLLLERIPTTRARLLSLVLRQPAMTLVTAFGIYWQAWRLWRKGTPVYDHPGARKTVVKSTPSGQESPQT